MKTKIFNTSLCIAGMLFGLLCNVNAVEEKVIKIENATGYTLKFDIQAKNDASLTKGVIKSKQSGTFNSALGRSLDDIYWIALELDKNGEIFDGRDTMGPSGNKIFLTPKDNPSSRAAMQMKLDYTKTPQEFNLKISLYAMY